MRILGLNAYHADSAACLLSDGRVLAAAEEERFRRLKHWAGCPARAVAYCLEEAGVGWDGVDCVAVNRDPFAHLGRKLGFALRARPTPGLLLDRLRNQRSALDAPRRLAAASSEKAAARRVERVEHHLAHLASAFYVSAFEEAVVVSLDGFGDFTSAAWGLGQGSRLRVDGRVFFPHSLGVFYQALTQYLGFPDYGDEYKVMGLAAYGRPHFVDRLERVLIAPPRGGFALDLRYFRHHRRPLGYRWKDGAPRMDALFSPALEDLLGPAFDADSELDDRRRDVACSAQRRFEDVLFRFLAALHDRYRLPCLTLAGGCALNSTAVGRITGRTPFERVFVQPAAGDAGGALGAALVAFRRLGGAVRDSPMGHAYWGPGYHDDDYRALLDRRSADWVGVSDRCELPDEEALCRAVAAHLAAGAIVGWFQGRMEWGPRALGNRSILCDPRRPNAQALLNERIKHREPFRPFAPSVLKEAYRDWFDASEEDPFMTRVVPFREQRRSTVPAVCHIDGTGRPQVVSGEANPLYHRLLEVFAERTGVPMLLNTSFNESEPIVRSPEEALDCFLRTGMDVLALGRHVLVRRRGSA